MVYIQFLDISFLVIQNNKKIDILVEKSNDFDNLLWNIFFDSEKYVIFYHSLLNKYSQLLSNIFLSYSQS